MKKVEKEVDRLLSQGKIGADRALKVYEESNLYTEFLIDTMEGKVQFGAPFQDQDFLCSKYVTFVNPKKCIEYSKEEIKNYICEDCEHLEKIKKILEAPMIEDAIQFINEKANETLYKGSIEIGEYILKHFFEGNPKLASSKNPKKQQSFNLLCQREDLFVHPNQLGLMVRVASQEQYFIEKKFDIKALSYTHKASLVKMDNGLKKTNMVKKCVKEEWTTRRLEDEIKKYLKILPSSSKPSLIRTTKKYITKIDDILKTVDDTELDFDADDISKMTGKKREALKTYLSDLEAKAKEGMDRSKTISERCSSALKELAKIETEKKKNPVKRGRPPKKK